MLGRSWAEPCDAQGPSQAQHAATWNTLATALHQVEPDGDTTLGTLLNTKHDPCQKKVENTSENPCFDDLVLGRPCASFSSHVDLDLG